MNHTGTFLEIIWVENGWAVYDFSHKQYDLTSDRKAVPMLVFNSKQEMANWIVDNWNGQPYDPMKP